MITKFIAKFTENQSFVINHYSTKHPNSYEDIIKVMIEAIRNDEWDDDESLDPERIHVIDDGHYQGTLIFVIACKGYQPSNYWYTKVDYGSCSGCDTLEAITSYDNGTPTEQQCKDYTTLTLHILQNLKAME